MSKAYRINPGATVTFEDKRYTITHSLDLETVLAKDGTGVSKQLRIKDLRPDLPQAPAGTPEHQELSEIAEEEWKEAERWLEWLRPLLEAGRRTAEMVRAVADSIGVHYTTVYRKLARYERAGLTSALLRTNSSGGRGETRLSKEVEEVVTATVEEYYKKGRRRRVNKTYDEVVRRCKINNLEPPHRNTVANRIMALSQRERDEAQEGPKVARQKNTIFPNKFPGADWPLAVTQIDHTQLDIELVDDVDRLPIGRPWLTVLIDVFSRMVLGFYLSPDRPNSMSVGLCLTHAILPKESWLTERNVEGSWPCWGFMRKIHADNAGEFRGKMLKRACKEYDIDLEWRPVKKPHYGAHIERLLGTFKEEIHTLPGTTFSNPQEKGDYNSEKEAVMTVSKFERWLTYYIVGVYHQREHSALGTSPLNRLKEGIFGTEETPGTGYPPRVFDERRLLLDLMPYEERTIQQYGVRMDYITYYSEILDRYYRLTDPDNPRKKRRFLFRRHPNNIRFLYFFAPDLKEYLEIPYRNMARPAINLWDLRRAKKRLEDRGTRPADINEETIFQAHEEMRKIEEDEKRETKTARRARQRRLKMGETKLPETVAPPRDDATEGSSSEDMPQRRRVKSFRIDDSV